MRETFSGGGLLRGGFGVADLTGLRKEKVVEEEELERFSFSESWRVLSFCGVRQQAVKSCTFSSVTHDRSSASNLPHLLVLLLVSVSEQSFEVLLFQGGPSVYYPGEGSVKVL